MSALRLDEVTEETLGVRVERCGERGGACLHRPAQFVRALRHRQGAFALNRWRGGLWMYGFRHLGRGTSRMGSNYLAFRLVYASSS